MNWLKLIVMSVFTVSVACGALLWTTQAGGKSIRGDVIVYNAAGNGFSDILMMEVNRGVTVNLSRLFLYENATASHSATWSPDGKYLAMVSRYNVTRGWRIIILNPDTGEVMMLTQPYALISNLGWYPLIEDTPRLVFNVPDRNERLDIYTLVVTPGSRPQVILNHSANETAPQWSPDGRWLAYISDQDSGGAGYDLYMVDSEGGNPRRLTTTANIMQNYDWSPDSQFIAFATPTQRYQSDIFTVNIASGETVNLTAQEAINMRPVWASNGEYIVFTSNRAVATGALYAMKTDGQAVRRLLNQEIFNPSWSPDGTLLTYETFGSRGLSEIHVFNLQSGRSRRLSSINASTWLPVWRPGGGS